MTVANGPVTWQALGALAERVAKLEAAHERDEASSTVRSNRVWLIVLGCLTGIVFPVLVTTLIAWLHLRG